MKNKNKLVKKLSTDVKRLENKIEHRTLYNIRDIVIMTVLKSGIVIDYCLPFIVSSLVMANYYTNKGNAPFIIDKVINKANVETTDTSNGIHFERISYDFKYDEELLEYSTKWIINDKGLYQRTITFYRVSDEILAKEPNEILSMSKEEIENNFIVENIQTICKNTLTKDDEIYNEDMLIIINHLESENEVIVRDETTGENTLNSIGFILLSLYLGTNITYLEKLFVKTYIRDKLKEYEPLFRPINKKELETAKHILELKRQNLIMISETANSIKEPSYKLKNNNKNHQYIKSI